MRDKVKYNSYQKSYQLQRYHARRLEAIDKLGGKCIKCNSLDKLELDHVDRNKKSFKISKLWSISNERFQEEVTKCQVLCRDCHELKTLDELGQVSGKNTHGSLSSYRYCKCDICRKAHNKYAREWRKSNLGV